MSGMTQPSHVQLIEDMQKLIAELERLKASLTVLGRWTQVETVDGAIEGVRRSLGNMERPLYH
jgi:hypothetical protein